MRFSSYSKALYTKHHNKNPQSELANYNYFLINITNEAILKATQSPH